MAFSKNSLNSKTITVTIERRAKGRRKPDIESVEITIRSSKPMGRENLDLQGLANMFFTSDPTRRLTKLDKK